MARRAGRAARLAWEARAHERGLRGWRCNFSARDPQQRGLPAGDRVDAVPLRFVSCGIRFGFPVLCRMPIAEPVAKDAVQEHLQTGGGLLHSREFQGTSNRQIGQQELLESSKLRDQCGHVADAEQVIAQPRERGALHIKQQAGMVLH